jgi:hypothetical protein
MGSVMSTNPVNDFRVVASVIDDDIYLECPDCNEQLQASTPINMQPLVEMCVKHWLTIHELSDGQ